MQEFSENVLILHVGQFREADAWLRLLSPTRGVFTAFAFGGCKSRRRFCGCLDPFNEVLFKIKSSRRGEYLNLEEGVLRHAPRKLRCDPQRLGLAVNCIKFAEAAADMTDGCAVTYGLLKETLHVLDEAASPSAMVPVLFRARLAFEQGLWPELQHCAECGKSFSPEGFAPEALASDAQDSSPALREELIKRICAPSRLCRSSGGCFFVERGKTVCPQCVSESRGQHLPLCGSTLDLLTLVRDSSPQHWQELELPPAVRRECAAMVERFVRYHLGLAWDRGRFRQV